MAFGTDLSCTDSVEVSRFVSGVELVAQALYRRLTTRRGALLRASVYGLDLASLIGANPSGALLASLPSRVKNECEKDRRVSSVTATYQIARTTQVGIELNIQIAVTLVNGESFAFSVLASSVSVQYLGMAQ